MQNRITWIVAKLATVLLASIALSNQSLAADVTLGGSVQVGGAISYPDGTTITPPCVDPNARFKDCGDGTVYDKQTGLMWEKKEDCGGVVNLSNPHCRANTYTWTQNVAPFTEPNGTLYSDFLQLLNGLNFTGGAPCFAGHCDWRIPTVGELRSILTAQYPAACPAPSPPCIAPIFGPTQASGYWSASSLASVPDGAWGVYFDDGFVYGGVKNGVTHARAVRSGR